MRVAKDYQISRYGQETGELMNHINRQRKNVVENDLKILYKRMYSWLQKDVISSEDKEDIDTFIRNLYIKFKSEYPTHMLEKFRFERRNKSKPYMTLDNVVFVPKVGRK